jgi:hypothetical protein
MKFNREKRPIKSQMKSRPPIFVSRQEGPHQSKNESLAARALSHRKSKKSDGAMSEEYLDAAQI